MRYINYGLLFGRSAFLTLPLSVFLLNIADLLTTNWGLSNGLIEMNPLFSFGFFVPLKFLGCGMMGLASYLQYRINPASKFLKAGFLCVAIVYSVVIINNFQCILQVLSFSG